MILRMWMDGILKVIAGFFLDIIETVVIALSVFLIVYLIFMQPHQVNGQSMDPTFHDKEYLLTDKITYRRRAPERGEVVVFHAPPQAGCPQGAGCDFIKRILGLPGETVEIKDGGVYVDGKKLDESYLPKGLITDPGMFTRNRSVTLGADEYFVSGDNRPHSSDSRAWGPIKFKEIVGRVFFRYWPPDRAGVISDPVYAK